MAHNRSPSRIRGDALATPAASYPSHLLELGCGCGVVRVVRVSDLARRLPGASLGEVIRRLRCGSCRAVPANVVLVVVSEVRRLPLRGHGLHY